MARPFIAKYLEQYAEELTPHEFYRRIFPKGALAESLDGTVKYHGILIDKAPDEKHFRHSLVFDDLAAIDEAVKDRRDAIISPIEYWGAKRLNKNARFMRGFALDWDGITRPEYLANFFIQCKNDLLPLPTFMIASGNGIHLYWLLKTPFPCYESNLKEMTQFKRIVTKRIWTPLLTSAYRKPEYESPTQAMRLVGGVTKDGGICRAFETGKEIELAELASFFDFEFKKPNPEGRTLARIAWPDWYERRIVRGEVRKYYTTNRGLYDRWIERIPKEAVQGHRYFCLFAAAVFAIKSGVSFEELERDVYNLVPMLDKLGSEPFTNEDAKAALKGFADVYRTFTREALENLTGAAFPPQRRNGRKQADHLVLARTAKELHRKNGTLKNPEGRPSREEDVFHWRMSHPQGTKTQCCRDLQADPHTVRRWWDSAPRLADKAREGEDGFDLSLLSAPMRGFLLSMSPEERRDWIRKNYDSLCRAAFAVQRREAAEGKGAER